MNVASVDDMPRDVREYVIRSSLQRAIDSARTPEEKVDLGTMLIGGAIDLGVDKLSLEMRDELVQKGFQLLAGLTGSCARCTLALYIHEGITIEGKLYHRNCLAYEGRSDTKCKHCSAEIQSGSKFCTNCGKAATVPVEGA